jgi:hypothetical protein
MSVTDEQIAQAQEFLTAWSSVTSLPMPAHVVEFARAIQEEAYRAGMASAVPDGWKVVPEVMTDEMLRSSCASELPAIFKHALRGENDGEKTTEMIDAIIRRHVKSYKAALSASPEVK